TGPHGWFGRDVFGMTAGYFRNDYQSIASISSSLNFEAVVAGTTLNTASPDLYDGSIRHVVVANQTFLPGPPNSNNIYAASYHYDQLYRITSVDHIDDVNINTLNSWTGSTVGNDYHEDFTYDDNGNILSANRRDDAGNWLDKLKYQYISNSNKLDH